MPKKLMTALIGFGKIAQGYEQDIVMARHYPYSTHAQVLRDHPAFDWQLVIDPDPIACQKASRDWQIPFVSRKIEEIPELAHQIEVAVIATPPNDRINILNLLPNLRAVMVEKPIGINLESSEIFIDECRRRGILVQVNLWRRADRSLAALKSGGLARIIGKTQVAFGMYGNGLLNNGTHMVDMVRMLFGEVVAVQKIVTMPTFFEGPIHNDLNLAFSLKITESLSVLMSPLWFSQYRENGLFIFGERGRLDILNEGLTLLYYPRNKNRAMAGEFEIENDRPQNLVSGAGDALYWMYENLAQSLLEQEELCSSGISALETAKVIEAIKTAPMNGELCVI
jgi:predicted dehydrogenase